LNPFDYKKLREWVGFESFDLFQSAHKKWIDDSLGNYGANRESHWTESVAIGSHIFVKKTLSDLGAQARGRRIIQTTETGDVFQIREESESYKPLFGSKKYDIAPKNTHDWM
jgi:putative transposase